MTEIERLRERHSQAVAAVALAEARFRRAEEEDAEARIDARHSGSPDPGTPLTDDAAKALRHAIETREAVAAALEDAGDEFSYGSTRPHEGGFST